MTHSFLLHSCPIFGSHVCYLVAATSRMARAPCESGMAPSVDMRSQSVKNLVFIGVGNLVGRMQSAWLFHGPMLCHPSSVRLTQKPECRCQSTEALVGMSWWV